MADRVVSLVAAQKSPPDEKVIAVIRDLLARAEAGEIRSIAAAVITSSGSAGSGYAFAERASVVQLLGATCVLRRELEDLIAAMNRE